MKFMIVLVCCLLAFVAANEDAKVLHNEAEVNVEDFKYSYEFDNHIKAEQSGVLKDKDNWIVTGSYEYVAPDGQNIKVTYTADESGYHPVVQH